MYATAVFEVSNTSKSKNTALKHVLPSPMRMLGTQTPTLSLSNMHQRREEVDRIGNGCIDVAKEPEAHLHGGKLLATAVPPS